MSDDVGDEFAVRDDLWETFEQRRDPDRAEASGRPLVGIGHRHTDPARPDDR